MRVGLSFDTDGAQHHAAALGPEEIVQLGLLADQTVGDRPGRRITHAPPFLLDLLSPNGKIGALATAALGAPANPVRLLVFDKTPQTNWSVAWHQDRTLAVRGKGDVPGYGPWSVKDGVQHVAPPVSVLERMATLRVHLDACGEDNAPLEIAPGSHQRGLVKAQKAAAVAEEIGPIACHAEAGDVWLYRTLILHMSKPSATPARRRVLQADYAAFNLPGNLEWLGVCAKLS